MGRRFQWLPWRWSLACWGLVVGLVALCLATIDLLWARGIWPFPPKRRIVVEETKVAPKPCEAAEPQRAVRRLLVGNEGQEPSYREDIRGDSIRVVIPHCTVERVESKASSSLISSFEATRVDDDFRDSVSITWDAMEPGACPSFSSALAQNPMSQLNDTPI